MTNNNKLVSILSYFIIGLIWLIIDEKIQNKITKFHAKQALNLLIIAFIIDILTMILMQITFGLLMFIDMIIMFGFLILWILGLINAINLDQKEIPIIGNYANKYLKF